MHPVTLPDYTVLFALFDSFATMLVGGLDRGRLTRYKAQSASFFTPCQMRLSA